MQATGVQENVHKLCPGYKHACGQRKKLCIGAVVNYIPHHG